MLLEKIQSTEFVLQFYLFTPTTFQKFKVIHDFSMFFHESEMTFKKADCKNAKNFHA